MKHIMLDLETFGTGSYSMIVSLGAVHFDPKLMKIKNEFYVTIDPIASGKAGFPVDMSTICWWLDPARRPAWDDYLRSVHFEPDAALMGFSQWIDSLFDLNQDPTAHDDIKVGDRQTFEPRKHVYMWGNGAGFDNVLLANAYQRMNIPQPWDHWNDRCFRTMKSLVGRTPDGETGISTLRAASLKPAYEGNQHNALIDARQQANWLMNIVSAFNLDIG